MITVVTGRKLLLDWLNIIGEGVVFSSQLHHLSKSVRFRVAKGKFSIDAFDSSSQVVVSDIDVQVTADEGEVIPEVLEFLVEHALLIKILGASKKDLITFGLSTHGLVVKTEARYELPFMPATGFPDMTPLPEEKFSANADKKFIFVMGKMVGFVDKTGTRPALAGIAVGDFAYIATDGQQGVVHMRVEDALATNLILLPLFVSVFDKVEGPDKLFIASTDSDIHLKCRNVYFKTKLINGEYPHESVNILLNKLSEESSVKLSVAGAEFLDALERVTLLSDDKFGQVAVHLTPKKIEFAFRASQAVSAAQDEIPVVTAKVPDGFDLEVFLNISQLKTFKTICSGGRQLTLTVQDARSAIVIKEEDTGYTFWLTPMAKLAEVETSKKK